MGSKYTKVNFEKKKKKSNNLIPKSQESLKDFNKFMLALVKLKTQAKYLEQYREKGKRGIDF